MVLSAMGGIFRPLVGLMCLVSLVSAEHSDLHAVKSSESRTSSKRGVGGGLTGVPGVLYSQYSPHVQPVPVPHPFPVPIPHPVPVQVPRPFPVTVHKPVGIPVPVGVPVPVNVPVPRPYPVPVPVNLPGGGSAFNPYGGSFGAFAGGAGSAYPGGPYSGGHFSGNPYSAGYFSGSPFSGSPFSGSAFSGSAFSGSPFSGQPYSPGSFSAGPSGPSALGKLGYGLGIYSPGSPSVPLAHPGLAGASLSQHSSAFAGAALLGLPGAPHHTDPLASAHQSPKY